MSMVKIRIHVGTGLVGSRREEIFEVDAEEWESMSEIERENMCLEVMHGLISWDWQVV
jgi:hypothetical protein